MFGNLFLKSLAETGRGFVSLPLFCFFIFLIKFVTNRLSAIFLVNCYMFIFANSPGYGTNRVTTSPGWNWSRSRHFCVLVWNLVYFLSKFKKVFDHNKDSEVFVPFFIVDNTISSKKRFLRACHSWSIRPWTATCNHWSHAGEHGWSVGGYCACQRGNWLQIFNVMR